MSNEENLAESSEELISPEIQEKLNRTNELVKNNDRIIEALKEKHEIVTPEFYKKLSEERRRLNEELRKLQEEGKEKILEYSKEIGKEEVANMLNQSHDILILIKRYMDENLNLLQQGVAFLEKFKIQNNEPQENLGQTELKNISEIEKITDFGEWIKNKLKEKNMRLKDLSEITKINIACLSQIQNNLKSADFTKKQLIFNALGKPQHCNF